MKILVTGGAGFIGSNLIDFLLKNTEHKIISIDNFDNFYDKSIKLNNIKNFEYSKNYNFKEIDITNKLDLENNIIEDIDYIIHLAAKAGVRPSFENPTQYLYTNIIGTQNIIGIALLRNTKRIIFASSSSVYGINENVPWDENDLNLNPISPYSASKIAAENLLKVYSNITNLEIIGLRFFTVYGPKQRPDLAIHKFVKNIINSTPIDLYGKGDTYRDYTYIDDVLEAINKSIYIEIPNKFEIFNIGNNNTVSLINLVRIIEEKLGIKALINFSDTQTGDVPITSANIDKANKILNYIPKTSIEEGISNFCAWYKNNTL